MLPGCYCTWPSSQSFVPVKRVRGRNMRSIARDPGAATLQFSQRCDLEYKLAVAREFRDERAFYFPHNVDFRCVYIWTLMRGRVIRLF